MKIYRGPNIDMKCTQKLDIEDLVKNNKAFSISDFIDLAADDYNQWEAIFSQYPAIYHRGSGVAFIPTGSPVDSYFIQSIKERYINFFVVTELPDDVPKVTIITDPLIRLCIGFRYTDNNIWYNKTGHPRGYFMSGTRAVQGVLDRNHWQMRNQIDIINEKDIDIAIPYKMFYKLKYDNFTWQHGIEHLVHEIHKQSRAWHHEYMNRPWQWGSVYNSFVGRHQYLEESIHYNIINDQQLSQNVRDYFRDDYQAFDFFNEPDGIPTSFKQRYDHYWLNLEK